jgi:hypothetical protein
MIGSTPRPASAATADNPIAPAPTTTRYLPWLHPRGAHVELSDRERVGQGHGIACYVAVDRFGQSLCDDHQFTEAALRLRVLTDDPRAVGAAVDQADRNGRHPGADRKLFCAARSMPDDLADEFMAEDDVAVRVVERAAGRVVDAHLRVIHEMHVRRADRGAQCSQQQLARAGNRVGDLSDVEPTVTQHHRTHPRTPSRLAVLDYSR